jgi:transglutaminase-like putative cysteine protease
VAVRDSRRAGVLLDHVVLVAALAVVAGGFAPLLSGPSWWALTVVAMACTVLTTGVLRTFAVPAAPVPGLLLATLVTLWTFVPETLLLGVVPTATTVEELAALLDRAQTIIVEEPPPVEVTTPLGLVVIGGFGLLAVLAGLLLPHRGGVLLIGALLVAAYLVPPIVLDDTPSFVVLTVAGGLWLVLLHRSAAADALPGAAPDRGRPPVTPGGVVVGAGALVLSLVLAPVLPDTTPLTGVAGGDVTGPFDRGINPMLSLGDDLRRGGSTIALEYTTDAGPTYLSVAMLMDFTGETWEPVGPDTDLPQEGRVDLDSDVAVDRQVVEVRIDSLRSTRLPVPYPAVGVDGLEGRWDRTEAGITYASESSDTREQTYAVTSLARRPTRDQLAVVTDRVPRALEPYLVLPSEVPEVVRRTAEEVAGDEVGAYARAQALEDYFRSGAFEYSESAPVEGDYDGTGVEVLERFLAERSGYCVHYASAMAVMARSLGVPSRIMVGYAPGELVRPEAGADPDVERYRVTSENLHAWPQIYVEGVGWTEFEPTPGIVDGSAADDDDADAGPTPTASTPEPTATTAAPTVEPSPEPTGPVDVATGQQQVERADTVRWTLLPLGLVVLVLLAPMLVRVVLRRRRLRRSASLDERWREVVATATDLGIAVDATTTVRAYSTTLLDHVDSASIPAVERLCVTLEQQRYGPARFVTVTGDRREDAADVVAALLERAPADRRRRARWLPRSLFR